MTRLKTQTPRRTKSPRGKETLDITVLAGGPGSEREVSLNSGRAVHEALVRLGHRAALCDIHPHDLSALNRTADLVFIVLHGEFGEDGTVQSELDRRGLAYTGSGAASSRRAMNKVDAKRMFERAGVPTPEFAVADRGCFCEIAATFPLPAVVKPVASGSSVDTSISHLRGPFGEMLQTVVEKYGSALVERYISGPELTVGILGDHPLPVCEIRTKRSFYDYQAKYIDDDTQYLFDLELPARVLDEVQSRSVAAHRALGCEVFSRVDWMVDSATLRPYALEVNTIPGFTSHSLLPKAAARGGIGFDELCARIVELSRGLKRS